MLIVPVSRRPDWRNPPLVTLLLILLNTLIFFGLQSGDGQRMEAAYRYYADSALSKIELPAYVKHLESAGKLKEASAATAALQNGKWPRVLRQMEDDSAFMERLRNGEIIRADDESFTRWQRERREFDRLIHLDITERYGFKTAAPTLASLFGHMFLHGSFDHLLGNMAILFLVGYLVEETLGKPRYLAYYLVAGLGAAAFDMAFNPSRMAPGIGASGAVSGVMAMFVALYGLRKIRFFYWAIVYFDFFRAPAIIMLPLWMANEVYQFFFNHGSPVNYMAHLGGFSTGAALIGGQRLLGKKRVEAPAQEAPVDPLPGELKRIDGLLNALRVEEARKALRQLAEQHPRELSVVGRYYKVASAMPASDDYHHAAALVFALPDVHPASAEFVYESFIDYLQRAKPSVRFTESQLIALIQRLARTGHAADAERLTHVLSRRSPREKRLPGLLLLVATAFRQCGERAKGEAMLERLRQDFPDSDEARHAELVQRTDAKGKKQAS